MVDADTRAELAICLDQLVAGEMTNDEFDDHYYSSWEDSADTAVAEIGKFGYRLYSSDCTPYRLSGRHAVSDETRQIAVRAVLFLRTVREYEWPRNVAGVAPFWRLWCPGCYLVVGLIFLFVAWISVGVDQVVIGIMGLLAIVPALHWLAIRRSRADRMRQFHAAGDFSVWPFIRQADLDAATKQQPVDRSEAG